MLPPSQGSLLSCLFPPRPCFSSFPFSVLVGFWGPVFRQPILSELVRVRAGISICYSFCQLASARGDLSFWFHWSAFAPCGLTCTHPYSSHLLLSWSLLAVDSTVLEVGFRPRSRGIPSMLTEKDLMAKLGEFKFT